jgi:cysteinyl-tRNA synthetase
MLGEFSLPDLASGIPPEVWRAMGQHAETPAAAIPDDILALVAARQEARERRDWPGADALRSQLTALGWNVRDTPAGPVVERLE